MNGDITYRGFGYGYEGRTDFTEVPGTGNTRGKIPPGMILCASYGTQPALTQSGTVMVGTVIRTLHCTTLN